MSVQIIILLTVLGFTKAEASCDSIQKLEFPKEVLSFYFSAPNRPRIIPIANNKCEIKDRSIRLLDDKKEEYAEFKISKIITTKFNDVVKGRKDFAPELKAFNRSLGKGVSPYKFFNLLYMFNNGEGLNFRRDITFAYGGVSFVKRKQGDFDSYDKKDGHWAAKSIDYKAAIDFLSKGQAVDFVHIKNDDNYHMPIINNLTAHMSFNNIYKTKYTDIVSDSQLVFDKKKKEVVVFSKALQYHQGYNTITNLYLAGYRKIYWFHKSFMEWQAKYDYMKRTFYDGLDYALSNSEAESLLSKNRNVKILDLSSIAVYNQVHFKRAKIGQIVFYDTEVVESYIKNSKNKSIHGTYNILNASELFPNRSTILIVTFNHYLNEYKAKEIYRRLVGLGHKVFILKTSTGEFLDYLRSRKSVLAKDIIEKNKTREVFTWRG